MSAGDLAGQPRPAPPWLRNRAPRCRRLSIVPAFLPWLPPDSEPGSPSPGWERIRALGDGPPPPAGALGQGPPTCSARLGSSPGASVLLASVSPLEKIEKSGGAHLAEPDEGSMGSHVQEAEHLCPQVRFQSTAQLGAVGSESAPVSGPEWISQEIVPPRPTSPPPPAPGKKWGGNGWAAFPGWQLQETRIWMESLHPGSATERLCDLGQGLRSVPQFPFSTGLGRQLWLLPLPGWVNGA